jgi:signal transduction histidine kinase
MVSTPSLPKVFAAFSAAVFVVAAAALGWVQHGHAVAQMQQGAEEHNAALAAALANALEKELGAALSSGTLLAPERVDELRGRIARTVRGTHVAKVKIYNASGLTIFSSDPKQIGEDKSANPGFRAARDGQVASSLTHRDQFDSFDGVIAERDLLFSYIPIGTGPEARGVFEIYTDVTHFKAQIQETLIAQLAMLSVAFGIVFILLLASVVRGSRAVERQHRENLRLAAEVARAETASRAKSEFLMHMSHELRTPLNAIIGFSEIIKDQRFGPLQPPSYHGYVKDIHASGVRLLDMISDLLELARLQIGGMTLAKTEIAVEAAIREVAEVLRSEAETGGVTIALEIAPGLAPVLTDARRLRQLLYNLVENAAKLTPSGGTVRVRAEPKPTGLAISVSDGSAGMPQAELAGHLAPFDDDASTARKSEGSGLSLPISRALAEMLGGSFWIESPPGRGAVRHVLLPAELAVPAAIAA